MACIISRSILILCGLWLACSTSHAEEPKRDQIGTVLGKPVYRDQVTREGRGSLSDQVHELFHQPVWKKYLQDHKTDVEFTEEELTFAAHELDDRIVNEHNALLNPNADPKTAKKPIRCELDDIQTRLAKDGLTLEDRQELLKQKAATEKRLNDARETFRMTTTVASELFVTNPKLTRHLYEKYGGGRVLVTKWGTLAFDAYQRWLDERASLGEFEITEPKMREAVKQARQDDLASWEKQPRRGTSFLSKDREYIDQVLNPPCLPRRERTPKKE